MIGPSVKPMKPVSANTNTTPRLLLRNLVVAKSRPK
jgi:hypothetical protein